MIDWALFTYLLLACALITLYIVREIKIIKIEEENDLLRAEKKQNKKFIREFYAKYIRTCGNEQLISEAKNFMGETDND